MSTNSDIPQILDYDVLAQQFDPRDNLHIFIIILL